MDEDLLPEPDEPGFPAGRFRWTVVPMHVLAFVGCVFDSAGDMLDAGGRLFGGLAQEVASHYNWQTDREEFAAEAGRELESILSSNDDISE